MRGVERCVVNREVLTWLGRVEQLTKMVHELEMDGEMVRTKPC